MLRFDKATYLSLHFKFILSVRLSSSLWESDVLLFLEFINILSILVLYLYWIHYLCIHFLLISLTLYKKCVICLFPFSKFSDVLPAFSCAKANSNFWSICLRVNTLRLEWPKTLSENLVPSDFIGNIMLSKASRTLSLASKSAYKFKNIFFPLVFLWILRFCLFFKIQNLN